MQIVPYTGKQKKRYTAVFADGTRTHFGLAGGSTYIDHRDKGKRAAYVARHRPGEDWSDPKSAGALSRYLLWGESTSLAANVRTYRKTFLSIK